MKNQNQNIKDGEDRIEQIKSEISNAPDSKVAKAEVVEMWEDTFSEAEQ